MVSYTVEPSAVISSPVQGGNDSTYHLGLLQALNELALALGTVSNTKVFNKLTEKKVFNSFNYFYLSGIISEVEKKRIIAKFPGN